MSKGAELANFAVPYLRDKRNFFHSEELADKIAKAVKFIVDGDVAAAMISVARTKPSTLCTTVPLAAMPYPLMWIEMKGKERFYRADLDQTKIPERVGFLIESIDGPMVGEITQVQMGRGVIGLPFSQWVFDNRETHLNWSETMKDLDNLWSLPLTRLHEREIANCQQFHKEEPEAVRALYSRDFRVPNTYTNSMMKNVMSGLDLQTAVNKFTPLLDASIEDTRGDNLVVRSILSLLNSRNALESEAVSCDAHNKRMRKRGRADNLQYEHKVLKLKLLEKQRAYLRGCGMSEAEIRSHRVRGHFKIRKTGIFWWSDFMRGSAKSGYLEKDYEVE